MGLIDGTWNALLKRSWQTGAAIIAGGETSEVLQLVEAPLDVIALAIEHWIVRNDRLAAAVRRGHGLHADVADGAAVVGLLGQHSSPSTP